MNYIVYLFPIRKIYIFFLKKSIFHILTNQSLSCTCNSLVPAYWKRPLIILSWPKIWMLRNFPNSSSYTYYISAVTVTVTVTVNAIWTEPIAPPVPNNETSDAVDSWLSLTRGSFFVTSVELSLCNPSIQSRRENHVLLTSLSNYIVEVLQHPRPHTPPPPPYFSQHV